MVSWLHELEPVGDVLPGSQSQGAEKKGLGSHHLESHTQL